MITESSLRSFFDARCWLLAARRRVPSPARKFTRYTLHNMWHVLPYTMSLDFDDPAWIEVRW